MPALDAIHNAVKNALIKDGWTITADPFTIVFEEAHVHAVSDSAYANFFGRKAFQVIIERYQIPLIVVNLKGEEIVLWTG